MKYAKVTVTCKGCGNEFRVSPSRKNTASFCSSSCYYTNQHKRRGSSPADLGPQAVVGHRFGRLVVVGRETGTGMLRCVCDCGSTRLYGKNALTSNRVKSCGCFNRVKRRKPGAEAARAMWFRYLQGAAKQRNIQFCLSFDEVMALCAMPCAYCGAPPSPWEGAKRAYITSAKGANTRNPDHAFAESKVISINGVDRTDSTGCYETSNVVAACTTCNLAKLDSTRDNFLRWVKRVYEHNFTGKKK